MADDRDTDWETLLAQAGWVRALARHLTADAHTASDLAQDALVAALDSPPPTDRPLRGWLAGIVRNVARQDRRASGNRAARERTVARAEAETSSADVVERHEMHRVLVDAVAALDEPYRATILMRYFDGLSPVAIAARTGTPLRTVHTRLGRGLARLRAELDRRHGGDRERWLTALLPCAVEPARWSALTLGVLLVDAKLKLVVAATVLAGVCATIALWPAGGSDVQSAAAPDARAAVIVDAPGEPAPVVAEPAEAVRRALEPAPAAVATPAAPAAAPRRIGRVIDVDRAPVAGVVVRCDGGPDGSAVEATTQSDGTFALAPPPVGGAIDVATDGWTVLFRPAISAADADRELLLVVARAVTLAGVVVDEQGLPIEGATIAVPLPFGVRARFDGVLDSATTVERSARSDEQGRFRLAGTPLVPGTSLSTTRAPYLEDVRPVPAQDESALQIALRRAAAVPGRLAGRVVDAEGAPVEDAWVGLGEASVRSGAGGAFTLELRAAGELGAGARLRALKSGHLPAEIPPPPSGSAWPEPLVLALGGPTLTIAGRVVDGDGDPIAGAEVRIADETPFARIPRDGGEMTVLAGASVEGVLRGDPWAHRVRADAEGRFELRGLVTREYHLRATDERRMLTVESPVFAGASAAVLRMPGDALHERVAGRVTSLAGAPLAGMTVQLGRRTGPGETPWDRMQGTSVRTDAEGRFEFKSVSSSVDRVHVRGTGIGGAGFARPIGAREDVRDLAVAVPMTVHARVDAGAEADFDTVALLDEAGEPLTLWLHHGQSSYSMSEMRVHDGQSETFSVSEQARTIVLRRGGAEVRRARVELRAGELNTLRP